MNIWILPAARRIYCRQIRSEVDLEGSWRAEWEPISPPLCRFPVSTVSLPIKAVSSRQKTFEILWMLKINGGFVVRIICNVQGFYHWRSTAHKVFQGSWPRSVAQLPKWYSRLKYWKMFILINVIWPFETTKVLLAKDVSWRIEKSAKSTMRMHCVTSFSISTDVTFILS